MDKTSVSGPVAVPAFPAGIVPPSFDLLARRSLLLHGRDLDVVQDQLDSADIIAAAGWPDAATLLRDVVFIRQGFSPAAHHAQRKIEARVPPGETPASAIGTPARRGRQMLEGAVADLAALMTAPLDLAPLADAGGALATRASRTGVGPIHVDLNGFGAFVADLRGAMQGAGDPTTRGRLFARLLSDVAGAPPFDPTLQDGLALPDLAARLAFNSLRRFAIANAALMAPPFGSPALAAAVATLDDDGLGPYFRHVRHLIQDAPSLLGLIRRAADRAGGAGDADRLERWAFLLGARTQDGCKKDLVDDLADRGMLRAIRGLLDLERHRDGKPDRSLLWRIRDAGLDTGDAVLAASAQRAIAEGWPADPVEWIILADIEATVGDVAAVEAALEEVRRVAPYRPEIQDRFRALREGNLAPFQVHSGFMTPTARKDARAIWRDDGRRRVGEGVPAGAKHA